MVFLVNISRSYINWWRLYRHATDDDDDARQIEFRNNRQTDISYFCLTLACIGPFYLEVTKKVGKYVYWKLSQNR